MKRTVADHLLDRLEEWGIRTIFGYSGDGNQFGKYMSALLKGDSDALGVVWQSARQGWQALTTR